MASLVIIAKRRDIIKSYRYLIFGLLSELNKKTASLFLKFNIAAEKKAMSTSFVENPLLV